MVYLCGFICYFMENVIVGDKMCIVWLRIVVYVLLLVVFCGLFVYMVFFWVLLELDIICDCNVFFCENWEGYIENVYMLKIMNKI